MKKVVLMALLTIGTIAQAQNNDERFTLSVNTEPNAWIKDGLNFGIEVEYQMTYLYFKAGTYQFPNLNNIGYSQYHGVPLGFNLHSRFREHRIYTGLVLGFNYREGNPNPLWGVEGGYEYYFGKVGVGLQGGYLYLASAEFYGGKFWMFNGAVKFIIVL